MYDNFGELLEYCTQHECPISEAVLRNETKLTGQSREQVLAGLRDMFEVMRFAAMSARKESGNPAALPSPAALMMATVSGAQAQRRAKECGMLQVGMDADIALIDFSAPHLIPCHNVLNGLVWSAKGGDVAMTMVRGKILYENGCFPTIDMKKVVEELTEYAIPRLFEETK